MGADSGCGERGVMLAVFPADPGPDLAQFLDLSGRAYKAVAGVEEVGESAPAQGWSGGVLQVSAGADEAWNVARALREQGAPVLVLLRGNTLDELTLRDELYDDFCLDPFHPRELEARLTHLVAASARGESDDARRLAEASGSEPNRQAPAEIVSYGPLRINLHTYEAVVGERPLDLTFMEYELLRFLAAHPGRVFTREALLNQVWGYEYYGGARTVDVHVRRLRAKLGEENADLIQTVRSVGYRLGTYRWR